MLVENEKNELCFYMPAFLRLKVKDIDNINISDYEAQFSGTMLFSFYYGDTPLELIEFFLGKDEESKAILLDPNQM